MSTAPKRFLLSAMALALAGALGAIAAQAEETSTSDSTATPASASNSSTDDASTTTQTLDAVKVTARRRAERAQDVPTPLTVISGEELEANHIQRIQDFQQLLPSTNDAFIHSRQGSLAIRGIGNNPAADGMDGSAGVYLDNVFLGRPGMAVLDILDVDRLELLRGPQGTLFGKNTTAGVLSINTRQPSFKSEHSVEFSVAQRGYEQVKLTANGAISDTVAGRIQVYGTHDGGDITNLYNGNKLNGGTREGFRGQLLIVPDETFDLRLIVDSHREKSSYGTMVPYHYGPIMLAHAAAAGATNIPLDPSAYQTNIDSLQQSNAQHQGLSGEANWHLANGFTLTSITAWRSWDFQPKNDDGTNAPGIINAGVNVNDKQFSQEFRIASPTGGTFDYVAGAYYFHQNLDNQQFTYYGPNANLLLLGTSAGIFNNVTSIAPSSIKTDSLALFGQGTWHLDPKWDLTAGLRATEENKTANITRNAPIGASAAAAASASLRAWNSGDLSIKAVSPSSLLNLAYKVDPNILSYVSFSTGEKSGGVNLQPTSYAVANSANLLLVGPEKAKSLELGVKTTSSDHRLIANANVFTTKISGYQANAVIADSTSATGLSTILTNVGSIKSQGVEWDVRALVADGLHLNFNGSYNDAHYSSFSNAPCAPEVQAATGQTICNLTGQAVVGAPTWILNTGGNYEWNIGGGVKEYADANYSWRSEANGTIDNSQYSKIPSYGIWNLATGWKGKTAGYGWDTSVWVRNAFDTRYYTAVFQSTVAKDAYTAAVGLPRTVGATLRLDF